MASIRDFINIINESVSPGIKSDIVTGPAYWASYLVNNDSSGLSEDEKKSADKWREKLKPWVVVSTDGDEYYSNRYDLHSGTDVRGGDVIDYVVHKVPEGKDKSFLKSLDKGLKESAKDDHMKIASEILKQLGGSRFANMTGAREFVTTDKGIRFKIPKGIIVLITLNGSDLYDIKLQKIVKLEVKTIDTKTNISVENLIPTFEKMTGLHTSL